MNHRFDTGVQKEREKLAFFEYAMREWVHHAKTLERISGRSQAPILKALCGKISQRWFATYQISRFPVCLSHQHHVRSDQDVCAGFSQSRTPADILLLVLFEYNFGPTIPDLLGITNQGERLVMPLGGLEEIHLTMERNGLGIVSSPQEADTRRSVPIVLRQAFDTAIVNRAVRFIQFLIVNYDDLQIPIDNIYLNSEGRDRVNKSNLTVLPKSMKSSRFFSMIFEHFIQGIVAGYHISVKRAWRQVSPCPLDFYKDLLSSRHFALNRTIYSPTAPLEPIFTHFIYLAKIRNDRESDVASQDPESLIAIAQLLLDHGAVADPIVRAFVMEDQGHSRLHGSTIKGRANGHVHLLSWMQ